jgi:Zn ribbon nucleic-acid-binding protein
MKKLTRCGACGAWQNDPSMFTEEELNNAELVHCGCEEEEEIRYVTRDMAIDAQDLSLEGSRY